MMILCLHSNFKSAVILLPKKTSFVYMKRREEVPISHSKIAPVWIEIFYRLAAPDVKRFLAYTGAEVVRILFPLGKELTNVQAN